MSKHTTAPRTLSRRLVALLAALALLAAMALPVYAETQPEPPVQTQVEQDTDAGMGNKAGTDTNAGTGNNADAGNKSKTKEDTGTGEGAGAGADTDSTVTNGNTSQNPGVNSTIPADDTAPSTGTTQPSSTDNTAPPAAGEDKNNTNDTTLKDSSGNSESPEDVQQQDDGEAEDTSLATQAGIEKFRIYFVVPSSWGTLNDSDEVWCYGRKNVDEANVQEQKFDEKMTGTEEGLVDGVSRKVYYIELTTGANGANTVDCPKGLYRLHFYVKNNNSKVCKAIENSWTDINVFRNKCYYEDNADANKWVSYKYFDPTDHTAFKNQTMAFKNATADTLTKVVAHFYEKTTEGQLTQVGMCPLGEVDAAVKKTFEIPADACSYVQFTAGENNEEISSLYNFYGQNVEDGEKSFLFDANDCYCFVYSTKVSNWTTGEGRTIYYDATFSKLDAEHPDHAIPKANGTIYCRLWSTTNSSIQDKNVPMKKENENLYYIETNEQYDHISFSNGDNNKTGGNYTTDLEIPPVDKYVFPCYYADTSDKVTYSGGGPDSARGGYWGELGTVRDAETGKSTSDKKKDVVAIQKGTFVADPATKYISTTLYDYYTDYELNGNSRTDYIVSEGYSQQNWVTFREFDQAISDYYENYNNNDANVNKIRYPIYTGHFQPSVNNWPAWFADISEKLNLYGFDSNINSDAYKAFRAANNSAGDEDGSDQGKSYFAFQGIVANTLSAKGDLLMNSGTKETPAATTLAEPHFNESFLAGANSKNAKLGEVYHNVSFPFTKKQIFSDEPGVDYWWYDSSKTSLYLREDTSKKQLYLGNDKNKDGNNSGETADYVDGKSKNLDSGGRTSQEQYTDVKTPYGFFPFNESLKNQDGVASQYNYGYGAKLEIPFSITSDGKVESPTTKERVPIRYYFSGDDDVWVFIDNQLVLDIGGAHGKVSGILDFSQTKTENQKTIVTAYVSQVKNNKYVGKEYGPDEENHDTKTEITYTINPNDNDINSVNKDPTTYYQKNTVEIKDLTTGTHTLTMYYMERGMWESNMAVAFNFPDHNELQVKKEVNVDGVNALFNSCFTNNRLFNFTIRNQATHYGATPTAKDTVTTINLLEPGKSTSNQNSFTTTVPSTTDTGGKNRFTKVDSPPTDLNITDGTPLLNWYTEFEDLTPSPGSQKDKRYGILKLDGDQTIDITGMSYLSFDIYVDSDKGDAALSNMYLQLRDSKNRQKGCLDQTFIGGKELYGQVEMHNKQWITVKLSLNDMQEQEDFDWQNVKELRFGCNYPRNIYLRNIVFSSKAVPQKVTGFTTKQEDIADYGSADSGTLMPAKNAQYTSDAEQGTMVVDGNGGFVLKAGETISFKDQFRRGSYLSINEQVDTNLFDTHWTICEDGKAVKETKAGEGTKLTLDGASKDLENQSGTAPDDGRIENKNAEGENAQNNNIYDGTKPSKNDVNDKTIVFRSYAKPDATDVDGETKLKVEFVNTVKTGSLTIKKEQAANSEPLTGPYKFIVRFTDVGGHALEDAAIVVPCTVEVGKSHVIDNIPVGTRFTIEEVTPEDNSKLMSVSVTGGSDTTVLSDNTVRGSIVEGAAGDKNQAVATFTNTKQELLDITGTKVWKNADDTDMTGSRPTIYVQLQRRHEKTQGAQEAWKPVPYQDQDYLPVNNSYYGMKFNFLGLPAKDYGETDTPNFEYQVVEGNLVNGVFQAVGNNGTIKIDEKVYGVTYKNVKTAADNTNSAKLNVTIINKQQDPKFTLDITKADAENSKTLLPGVEFKLEKLKDDDSGKLVVDENFNKLKGITNTQGVLMLTDSSGNATQGFTELKAGTYRLTETKAAKDYNLLSAPIEVEFTKTGECRLNGSPIAVSTTENPTDFIKNKNGSYTLALTVLNRKTPTLPHTGADAPSLWLLIGLPLAVAGLLILVFRYNKKGGRQR